MDNTGKVLIAAIVTVTVVYAAYSAYKARKAYVDNLTKSLSEMIVGMMFGVDYPAEH